MYVCVSVSCVCVRPKNNYNHAYLSRDWMWAMQSIFFHSVAPHSTFPTGKKSDGSSLERAAKAATRSPTVVDLIPCAKLESWCKITIWILDAHFGKYVSTWKARTGLTWVFCMTPAEQVPAEVLLLQFATPQLLAVLLPPTGLINFPSALRNWFGTSGSSSVRRSQLPAWHIRDIQRFRCWRSSLRAGSFVPRSLLKLAASLPNRWAPSAMALQLIILPLQSTG